MGRFYRTALERPVDYMYKQNTPLMEKVLDANDQYITNNLQQLGTLSTAATSFPYLQPDEDRAKAIAADYSGKIDQLSQAIKADPAAWRKQLDPIRAVATDLQNNFRTGEVSKINSNYTAYKKVSDDIDKRVEEFNKTGKGIDPNEAKVFKESYLRNFIKANPKGTAYDPTTGTYNMLHADTPMDTMDVQEVLGKGLKDLKADAHSYKIDTITGKEMYKNTQTNQWEAVTPERVMSIVADRLHNPQLMNYLKERSQVGLINGAIDPKTGGLIAPYSYDGVPTTPEEQKQLKNLQATINKTKDPKIKAALRTQLDELSSNLSGRKQLNWNENAFLTPIMRSLVRENSYTNKDNKENLISANPVGIAKFNQSQTNTRHNQDLDQKERFHNATEGRLKERFDLDKKKFDFEKYKWDNPHEKAGTTAKGKDAKAGATPPVETAVSALATHSFEDMHTVDTKTGEVVQTYTPHGLSSDIDNFKKTIETNKIELADINKKLANPPTTPLEEGNQDAMKIRKAYLENNLASTSSKLADRRLAYEATSTAALHSKNISDSDRQLYKEFEEDRKGTNYSDYIKKLKKDYPDLKAEVQAGIQGLPSTSTHESPQVRAARDKFEKYMAVKTKVDKNREDELAKLRKDYINYDAITPNEVDGQQVANILMSNTEGLELFDSEGKPTSKKELDNKGVNWRGLIGGATDNSNMTFAGGQLDYYLKNSGAKMVVDAVAPTTVIGKGNSVVKVHFDDPNGEISPNETFYINTTPEMEERIAAKFKNSADPKISEIAKTMTNGLDKTIRTQLALAAGKDVTVMIPGNKGGSVPIKVHKIDNSNQLYATYYNTETKQDEPVPSINGAMGTFSGPKELRQSLEAIKAQQVQPQVK